MTDRLRFSTTGQRRRMEISRVDVFVFVEGMHDRPFYDRLCNEHLDSLSCQYSVHTGAELNADGRTGGGKQRLLSYFEYLRESDGLYNTRFGKKKIAFFFLDKDVDDIAGEVRQSPHITYTEPYEVENYLFLHGNIIEACASAAALDVGSVRAEIGKPAHWRSKVFREWKEWVILCLFSHLNNLDVGCRFGRQSQVHHYSDGHLNQDRHTEFCNRLMAASTCSTDIFLEQYKKAQQIVHDCHIEKRSDTIFPGSWYFGFLARAAYRAAEGRPYNNRGFEYSARSVLLGSLDFQASWAANLVFPLRQLVEAVLASDENTT